MICLLLSVLLSSSALPNCYKYSYPVPFRLFGIPYFVNDSKSILGLTLFRFCYLFILHSGNKWCIYISEMLLFCQRVVFHLFAFAVDWRLISLFLNEIICSFFPATDQWSNAASKCSNIQSVSIHNINISIHLNRILFYSSIYKELKIAFIFDKCVLKFSVFNRISFIMFNEGTFSWIH